MRVASQLSFFLGFALTVQALRYGARIAPEEARLDLKNFLITNLNATAYPNSAASTWNRTLDFLFTDLNSNTSTVCTTSWTQTSTNSNAPMNYVLCKPTNNEEVFQWQFISYTSIKQFSIEFMHGWNDPADFAPPYEYVGMFSTENAFNLTCVHGNGVQECYLPDSQSPYHAVINALTN